MGMRGAVLGGKVINEAFSPSGVKPVNDAVRAPLDLLRSITFLLNVTASSS
eukprot:CAMPEP_0116997734 /NCGR_PEP_ID=MMETSP0472-20121206/1059_1 /TAXON_ID=693140 ORGANISM="Tiarina fusus, Strain LIS" /NCGR_SAMPLE_ID=MMETSP0472 /ASSEMBLY_ACC=CAM_ASM_000603 /LENGTH=50 /DNA_ID=CAMNT_0004696689 /DNA_START=17 /DNA_END=169 /DNA_ORIENTATION=-